MTTQVPELTTTFTPDKSCFQYFKYRYTGTDRTCKEGGTGTPSACTYLQLGPSESDAGCLPSSLELGSTFYYSPGICPSGFEVACSSTFDNGETRATCCPSQFTCQSETRWPWYSTDLCTLVIPKTVDVIVSDSVLGGEWERKTSRGGGANAIGIPIRWHSSDFESTTAADTAATMTETGSSSTSASSSESESSHDGLSGGAKIGIGVGIGVGALLGIVALIWFVLRARRSKQANIEHTESKTPQMQQQHAPWEMEQRQAPMELDTQADMRPVELPTEGATYKK